MDISKLKNLNNVIFLSQADVDGLVGNNVVILDSSSNQIAELINQARFWGDSYPELKSLEHQSEEHIKDLLTNWVYYPWKNACVRLLKEPYYKRLLTERNKYKIKESDILSLSEKKIAIIGLSVGNEILQTLSQEGVGSEFRISDYDTIDPSNLNRLKATVFDFSIPKTQVSMHQLLERNPYLNVIDYSTGINEKNIEEFLTKNGKVDLIFEECDNLYTKRLVREYAQKFGIPLVMETNDRSMLDVERYDLGCELFNGILNNSLSLDFKNLNDKEKLEVVSELIDFQSTSQELQFSFGEIGKSISNWPQLASSVSIGAGISTVVARKILLGNDKITGRYYLDPFDKLQF